MFFSFFIFQNAHLVSSHLSARPAGAEPAVVPLYVHSGVSPQAAESHAPPTQHAAGSSLSAD